MPPSEPFELQLQRERVARTQVEALLESTRLQLIEMEFALRKAREDATRCLTEATPRPAALPPPVAASVAGAPAKQAAASRPSRQSGTPLISTMVAPPSSPESPAISPSDAPATSHIASPTSKPLGAPKPRVRRAAPRPAATSLIEAARAAEAIERAARADAESAAVAAPAAATPMTGMTPARAADPLISTLDLYAGDNRAIVTDFIQHLQTRIGKMQACYGSANFTELKWHVTWVRENAAAAGFAVLTLPATDLEMAIDTDAKDQIPACMDHVINQAERVSVEKVRR